MAPPSELAKAQQAGGRFYLILSVRAARRSRQPAVFALTHTLSEQILDRPFTERKSSSPMRQGIVELRIQAQGICFSALPSVQAAAVHNGLRVTVAAEHQVGDHCRLRSSSSSTTLFSLRRSSAISTIPGTVHVILGINDGACLLALQHDRCVSRG